MAQKMHGHGSDVRYFWSVGVKGEPTGVYRSRHRTASGVKAEFARNGKVVMCIRPIQS
jgi:hypothetical protein